MTRLTAKERKFRSYMMIQNELDELNGDKPRFTNFTDEYIVAMTTAHKPSEVSVLYTAVFNELINTKEKKRKETFFETEEGARFKKEREDALTAVREKQNAIWSGIEKTVNNMVKRLLGEQWAATFVGTSSTDIGIVDHYAENGTPVCHFGMTFQLVYDCYDGKVSYFKMNYGTTGSFELGEDTVRCEFLRGMAALATNKQAIADFKGTILSFVTENQKLSAEFGRLNEELQDPFRVVNEK